MASQRATTVSRSSELCLLGPEAAHPGRWFDVVICESVSRVARRAFEGLSIERELERVDVSLFASNEPIMLAGSRAQRVLQRRINQSVAEYEVLNILEQSWGGLCTHVREGWNIGKPALWVPGQDVPAPQPHESAKCETKTRLEPDGARGGTVTQIALWRYHEQLGYDTIADRLNASLSRRGKVNDPVKWVWTNLPPAGPSSAARGTATNRTPTP